MTWETRAGSGTRRSCAQLDSHDNFLPEIGQIRDRWSLGRVDVLVPPIPSGGRSATCAAGGCSSGGRRGRLSEMVVRRWGRDTLGEQKVNGRCHMSKQTMTDAPVCTWVAVTDASGRTRMEARWTSATVAPSQAA